jgi:hypothetical protein
MTVDYSAMPGFRRASFSSDWRLTSGANYQ